MRSRSKHMYTRMYQGSLRRRLAPRISVVLAIAPWVLVALGGCTETRLGICEPGRLYCNSGVAQTCLPNGMGYDEVDCGESNDVCHPSLGCVSCYPGALLCEGQNVVSCQGNGETVVHVATCDASANQVCYLGNCLDACKQAEEHRSYVGCEYWAVDLDNAVISSVFNAAAQQYAVVVSNPSTLPATVRVERNNAPQGWPLITEEVARVELPPRGLRVFNLPAREVDGSPPGTYNTGTHTALTSNAYRVVSNVPIVAYQFSPLDNVQVFSNDASLLVPTSALDTEYLVMGWPQTIAATNDPRTNFHSHLRAFLTVVGIHPATDVTVELSTAIVGGGSIPARAAGETVEVKLGPFDVLNLETGDFAADFTGSRITSTKPVAVFSGSEASDVPMFADLADRYCCADHLQHQLFPVTSAGTRFVVATMPARTPAVAAAGGAVSIVDEVDWIRILAIEDNTQVATSLPPPNDRFQLHSRQHVTIPSVCDFTITASGPIFVGQFVGGQATTGIAADLPGGDPSFILVPPVQQWRSDYVFLTPDKYAFDFVVIISEVGNPVLLDYQALGAECVTTRAQCREYPDIHTNLQVHRCQLSFPRILPGLPPPDNVDPHIQNDGYHLVTGNSPFGLIVYGFDKHVSYGYAGGTDLKRINVK